MEDTLLATDGQQPPPIPEGVSPRDWERVLDHVTRSTDAADFWIVWRDCCLSVSRSILRDGGSCYWTLDQFWESVRGVGEVRQ